MLRPMRDKWQMEFADSAEKALDIMKDREPFDVVVSDVRMPQMNGIDFLKKVKELYPNAIRIVLTGFAGKGFIQNVGDEIHRFLTKPTSQEVLTTTIERALSLRETLANDSMKKVVSQVGDLPSLPAIYTQLMSELNKPKTSLESISKIISKDIGLTGKILQLVNSAYFGNLRRISVVEQAVAMLGVNTIKAMALTTEVFKKLEKNSIEEFDLDEFWSHSVRVGNIARMIAEMAGAEKVVQGHAFTAGMLHDVGRLVFASKLGTRYSKILRQSNNDEEIICLLEQSAFGVSHAEIGAYMIGLWGLHDPVVEAIAYHHTPMENYFEAFSEITAVHVADGIADMIGNGIEDIFDSSILVYYIEKLGYADDLPKWFESAKRLEAEKNELE